MFDYQAAQRHRWYLTARQHRGIAGTLTTTQHTSITGVWPPHITQASLVSDYQAAQRHRWYPNYHTAHNHHWCLTTTHHTSIAGIWLPGSTQASLVSDYQVARKHRWYLTTRQHRGIAGIWLPHITEAHHWYLTTRQHASIAGIWLPHITQASLVSDYQAAHKHRWYLTTAHRTSIAGIWLPGSTQASLVSDYQAACKHRWYLTTAHRTSIAGIWLPHITEASRKQLISRKLYTHTSTTLPTEECDECNHTPERTTRGSIIAQSCHFVGAFCNAVISCKAALPNSSIASEKGYMCLVLVHCDIELSPLWAACVWGEHGNKATCLHERER